MLRARVHELEIKLYGKSTATEVPDVLPVT